MGIEFREIFFLIRKELSTRIRFPSLSVIKNVPPGKKAIHHGCLSPVNNVSASSVYSFVLITWLDFVPSAIRLPTIKETATRVKKSLNGSKSNDLQVKD